MKILLAEPNPATQMSICSILKKWNYAPICVKNGQEALDALKENGPVLIFVALSIPPFFSSELFQKIRSRNHSVYIVILTKPEQQNQIMLALDNGADDFLEKPIAEEFLLTKIQVANKFLNLEMKLAAFKNKAEKIVTICSYCKKMRNSKNVWQDFDDFASEIQIDLSHGICPHCYEQIVIPQIEELKKNIEKEKKE